LKVKLEQEIKPLDETWPLDSSNGKLSYTKMIYERNNA